MGAYVGYPKKLQLWCPVHVTWFRDYFVQNGMLNEESCVSREKAAEMRERLVEAFPDQAFRVNGGVYCKAGRLLQTMKKELGIPTRENSGRRRYGRRKQTVPQAGWTPDHPEIVTEAMATPVATMTEPKVVEATVATNPAIKCPTYDELRKRYDELAGQQLEIIAEQQLIARQMIEINKIHSQALIGAAKTGGFMGNLVKEVER